MLPWHISIQNAVFCGPDVGSLRHLFKCRVWINNLKGKIGSKQEEKPLCRGCLYKTVSFSEGSHWDSSQATAARVSLRSQGGWARRRLLAELC